MTLLEQASALLAKDGPFTLAQAKALDALCEQARDAEADLMGDLCSGLIIPDTVLGGTVATMTRGVQ
jgi:hypothetical protein